MASTKATGAKGEGIAANYLKGKSYQILARNYFLRAQGGPKIAEIDIIAKIRGCFVFVEVKTIVANGKYLAQDKVDGRKLWKIAKAAEMWLAQNKIPLDSPWRIDVIAIDLLPDARPKLVRKLFGPKCKISHFENVSTS